MSCSTAAIVDAEFHPLDPLNQDEIKAAASAIRAELSNMDQLRFVAISLLEPLKADLLEYFSTSKLPPRRAEAIVLDSSTGISSEINLSLSSSGTATVDEIVALPAGVQPLLTPDDCFLAEEIVKSNETIKQVMKERYGLDDLQVQLACDPWSVHLASAEDRDLAWTSDKQPRRLVQTFLYQRMLGADDNHYAHPIDLVPIVDLNTRELVKIDGLDREPPPKVPQDSVNYHRDLVKTNSYLEAKWRQERLAPLHVIQPDGPSFEVTGNLVKWQKWSFRVGFNYREGLVLHNVRYEDRPILHRASLVEMAVPYGDPHPPFQRKCAFDVGDYGLGYCANSLELGCDCLGHIYYFDATLVDSQGEPVKRPKVVCMHEEDAGILWKHVDYRSEHNESRRARELVISSIATVVNYEYLFYWRLKQDGTIDFQIKLSGELSTNLPSLEEGDSPTDGVLVAPGVNAQIHQHMFCARLDMAVDGYKNTVSEVDFEPIPDNNPYGNRFGIRETVLQSEQAAIRMSDSTKARSWRVASEESVNHISGKKRSYKLVPFSMGPAQPTVLTNSQCEVSKKGAFAGAHLWVTPHNDKERFPAGEHTPQGDGSNGLPDWTQANRPLKAQDVVLWHSFGVCHMPRVEDFPVMPCEVTGFMLKPDGFFNGNPAVDLEPDMNDASRLADGCCVK